MTARAHPTPIASPAAASSPSRVLVPRATLVLVGLMGAGKSSVGRRLAGRLELPFVDADHEIEAAAGMTVEEIFARHGEPAFRDGERRVIGRLLENPVHVLATGGGAFMDARTRALIRARAISIWLHAELD
jgi:shikimate kinase